MQKQFRRKLLTMVVLCSMLAVGGTVPASAAEQPVPATISATMAVSASQVGFRLLDSDVHERTYLEMLVKAYDSGSLTEWKSALADRTRVNDKITRQVIIQEGDVRLVDRTRVNDELSSGGEFTVTLPDSVTTKDGKLSINIKDGKTVEVVPCTSTISAEDKVLNEKISKLYSEFTEAVSSSNEAAIKKILPQILDDYRAQTAKMEQGLNKVEK